MSWTLEEFLFLEGAVHVGMGLQTDELDICTNQQLLLLLRLPPPPSPSRPAAFNRRRDASALILSILILSILFYYLPHIPPYLPYRSYLPYPILSC